MCLIDPAVFDVFHDAVPLFPGQEQHWVLAINTVNPEKAADRAKLWMLFNGPRDIEQLEVTGMVTGTPKGINGRVLERVGVGIDADFERSLPPTTTYVAISFTYLGTAESHPWEWDYDDCPEDVNEGLFAVFKPNPAVHVPTPFEEAQDTLDRTIEDIADDAQEVAGKAKDALHEASGAITATLATVGVGLLLLEMWKKRQ